MSKKRGIRVCIFISLLCLFLTIPAYAITEVPEQVKKQAEEYLKGYEEYFEADGANFNLDKDDIIKDNLELGEVYKNNKLELIESSSSSFLEDEKYLATIRLKDSKKPIATATIMKLDGKWQIIAFNSYNLLDEEIEKYKKEKNTDDIVLIFDDARGINAITSKKDSENIKILDSRSSLSLGKDKYIKAKELKSKINSVNNSGTGEIKGSSSGVVGNAKGMIILLAIFAVLISSYKLYDIKNHRNRT